MRSTLLPVDFEISGFQPARWIAAEDRKKLDTFLAANNSGVADDVDGDPVFLAKNQFYLDYTCERSDGITFSERPGREEESVAWDWAVSFFGE